MTLSDILRTIADRLASVENGTGDTSQLGAKQGPIAKNFQAMQAPETQEISTSDPTPLETFVPPLQQKLELLKKSVGVDNIFDNGEETDELEAIKRNAGISPNTTAIMALSDDEPLDD